MVISLNGFRGKITLQHLFSNTPTPTPNNYGFLPHSRPNFKVSCAKFQIHGSWLFFFFWLTEKSSGHRSVSIMNRLASIINITVETEAARDACVDSRPGLAVFIDCWTLDLLIWRFVTDVSASHEKFRQS